MKIFLAIPAYQSQVHAALIHGALQLYADTKAHGDQLTVEYFSTPLISYSRNALMEQGKDADWILMWDADVQINERNFAYKLIETAKQIEAQVVGVLTRIKSRESFEYGCAMKVGDGYKRLTEKPTDPIEVDVIAGGVHILDNRWVRANMEQPFYEINDLPGGKIMPEDWRFCEKVKKAGGKIVIDPSPTVIHWGSYGWVS